MDEHCDFILFLPVLPDEKQHAVYLDLTRLGLTGYKEEKSSLSCMDTQQTFLNIRLNFSFLDRDKKSVLKSVIVISDVLHPIL